MTGSALYVQRDTPCNRRSTCPTSPDLQLQDRPEHRDVPTLQPRLLPQRGLSMPSLHCRAKLPDLKLLPVQRKQHLLAVRSGLDLRKRNLHGGHQLHRLELRCLRWQRGVPDLPRQLLPHEPDLRGKNVLVLGPQLRPSPAGPAPLATISNSSPASSSLPQLASKSHQIWSAAQSSNRTVRPSESCPLPPSILTYGCV